MPPLWTCDKCLRQFANRNQSHSCGRYQLEPHFAGKPAAVRATYEAFVDALLRIGPVTILPERTRIAFQVRMTFAQLTPRRSWVDGHLILAQRVVSPLFRRVETFSPRNHLHAFRLSSRADIDDELRHWMVQAYEVGAQRHLHPQ